MTDHPEHCIDPRGKEYLTDIFNQISKGLGTSGPKESIAFVRNMMNEMNMENPVAVNREQELGLLTESVNPVRLKNNPVELTRDVLFDLYNRIVR